MWVASSPPGKPRRKRFSATQLERLADVDPIAVDDAAGDVAERDDGGAALVELLGDHAADVAKALDCHPRGGDAAAEPLHHRLGADRRPHARRRFAALGAAEHDRLAGDDPRRRLADVLAVGVHEPRHLALARRHVGGGYVLIGADHRHQLAGEATSGPLHLGGRETVGVAADAALGAAEGQAEQSALEAHPERQGGALAERDAGRVAYAALGRAEREGVLDPVAGEALDLAAVAADREVDDDRAARLQQAGAGVGVEPEQVGGLVELGDRDPPQLRAPLAPGRDVEVLALEDALPTAGSSAVGSGGRRRPAHTFSILKPYPPQSQARR